MPVFPSIHNRIKEFREHYEIPVEVISNVIDIPVGEYCDYESGKTAPTIDILLRLSDLYKVTLEEFYGNVPMKRELNSNEKIEAKDAFDSDFKFSDLSPDEKELILRYRLRADKEDLFLKIMSEADRENEQN